MSIPAASLIFPLACSIMTRLTSASLSWSISAAPSMVLRCWMMSIVATSASAWTASSASASSDPLALRNMFSAPTVWPHRCKGSAWAE